MEVKYFLVFVFLYHNVFARANEDINDAPLEQDLTDKAEENNEDVNDAPLEQDLITDKAEAKKEEVAVDEREVKDDSVKFPNENKDYEAEKKAGDPADLFGANQHHIYPDVYKGFGRRYMPQYRNTVLNNQFRDDDVAEEYLDVNIQRANEDNNGVPLEEEFVTDKVQAKKEEDLVDEREDDSFKFPNENKDYEAEEKAGDPADLFGANQHHIYPDVYKDLGRRFVLQYPYKVANHHLRDDDIAEEKLDFAVKAFQNEREANRLLKPVKAPPELVLAVARQSALLEAAKTIHPSNKLIQKDILRLGNYWNDVWKEEVDPKILRTQNDDSVIQSVKVKIMPGSKLYQLVSALKTISPRLIYVINNK